GQFGINVGIVPQMVIAVLFSILVGFIALRGVNGSTMTAMIINIIQLVALVGFSVLAIWYRVANPDQATFIHASPAAIVLPKNLLNTLMQATVAILILVGFESCTAFGAEAKNARRDVPRAVILALVIQGLFAYLFEYFAANYGLSDKLVGVDAHGKAVQGLDAAAASSAPIGDMIIQMVNSIAGGAGFGLMIVIAI